MNPNSNKKNQKILKFSIKDRDAGILKSTDSGGQKIKDTLSFTHLFRYAVSPESPTLQRNFEEAFGSFEERITHSTHSFLEQLRTNSLHSTEAFTDIFLLKFLNFVRNPHNIKEVLNSFSAYLQVSPGDKVLKEDFYAMRRASKPQKHFVAQKFGVSLEDYENWLRLIFILMLHFDTPDKNSFFRLVEILFQNPIYCVTVEVHEFDNAFCLLSDRSVNIIDHRDREGLISLEFNLHAKAFMRVSFIDVTMDPSTPENIIQAYISRKSKNPEVNIFPPWRNDLDALTKYNQLTSYQCFEHVFCASNEILGVSIV